jgi:hypothetical protein
MAGIGAAEVSRFEAARRGGPGRSEESEGQRQRALATRIWSTSRRFASALAGFMTRIYQ